MKKLAAVLTILMLVCTVFSITASAEGSGAIAMSSASGVPGDTVTLSINMSSNPGLVTMSITVSFDTNVLELTSVSDKGLIIGSQLNQTYGSPYKISWMDGNATENNTKTGEIATFTFKIKDDAAIGDANITLKFNDSYDTDYKPNTFSASSGKVTVNCKTHTYGEYAKADDKNHSRTCSACGNVDTAEHTWNQGTVTKEADCKETGTKEFECTVCKGTKTETIDKTTDHKYGEWTEVKAADCTEKGEEKRTCSVCQNEDKRDIDAKGHDVKNYTVTKEATCKAEGTKEGECTVCKKKISEKVEKLEHKYGEPEIKKEATATAEGLKVYTCTECKETKEEKIPKLTDETTAPETTAPETTEPVTTAPITTPAVTDPESTSPADVTTKTPETTQKAPDKLIVDPDDTERNNAPVIAVIIAVVVVGCVAATAIIILRKHGMI